MRLTPPPAYQRSSRASTSGEEDSRAIFSGGVSTAVENPSPCKAMTYLLGFSNELFHWGIPRFENNDRCKNGHY